MASELTAVEPKLKEILYRCLEEIRSTKAALFLLDDNVFRAVTFYGFRELERPELALTDDLIDRLLVKRTPFYVNSLTEDPRYSQMLFAAGTTRMLLAPIYSRGKLIGFIDMRDKAAKQPFQAQDIVDAQKIIDLFLDVFAQNNLFGQQKPQASLAPQRAAYEPPGETSNALAAIDEAKRIVGRGLLKSRNARETLTDEQIDAAAVMLPAFLGLPPVLFAALSSFGRYTGVQRIVSRAEFKPDASAKFEVALRSWLQSHGESEGLTSSTMVYPLGKSPVPIDSARLVTILSAPVQLPSMRGMVVTVGFDSAPSADTRKLLAGLLGSTERVLNQAISHELLGSVQLQVAEKLVEPYTQRFTVLMSHSRRVSEMAARFADFLQLPRSEVDRARLAGLVHDVGMRQLDYHSLYRKGTLSADEMKVMKEHPTVSAALVADSPLGPEIANIVLCHHERPDGTGYPNALRGEEIPMLSRLLHICEAYDAMTAPDSYQTPIPQPAALARIRRVAGSQLDGDLASSFAEMMSAPPPLR